MLVAVTSQGIDLDAAVDPRFGRASRFLLIDTDGMFFKVIENRQNLDLPQVFSIRTLIYLNSLIEQIFLLIHPQSRSRYSLSSRCLVYYSNRNLILIGATSAARQVPAQDHRISIILCTVKIKYGGSGPWYVEV